MSLNSSRPEPVWSIELRTAAIPIVIPTLRTVGADIALRADFNLDSIDDIRMAVDEVCTTLIRLAAPDATLNCRFAILPDRIELAAEVEPADSTGPPLTGSFGWRVLETLADEVSTRFVPDAAGQQVKACIQLTKIVATSAPP